jgi:hypothetical protein
VPTALLLLRVANSPCAAATCRGSCAIGPIARERTREEEVSPREGFPFSPPAGGHSRGLRSILELVELGEDLLLLAIEPLEVRLRRGLELGRHGVARLLDGGELRVDLPEALAPDVLTDAAVDALDRIEVDLGQAQLALRGVDRDLKRLKNGAGSLSSSPSTASSMFST